jgi:hypothetical protein
MEDSQMKSEEVTLQDYIKQYTGHQRFYRLEALIDHGTNLPAQTVEQAINLGYQLAAESRNLGMYLKIQKCASTYYSKLGKPVPPNYEAGKVNANKMQSDYS